MEIGTIIAAFDLLGVGVFAITGALAAAEKRLDILSFILFGTITGIGGGTARDLLLNIPQVFWIEQPLYLWVCLLASVATWFLAHRAQSLSRLLLWADAVGLSLFCVLGTAKAIDWNAPFIVAVGMGMMTATFGSLIRDSLLTRPAVLLGPDIYVTAALLGSCTYVILHSLTVTAAYAMPLAIASAFSLRAAAILFDLRLPKYKRSNDSDPREQESD